MEKELKDYSTSELVRELEVREGVEKKRAEPYEDLAFEVNGPATVLVITD